MVLDIAPAVSHEHLCVRRALDRLIGGYQANASCTIGRLDSDDSNCIGELAGCHLRALQR